MFDAICKFLIETFSTDFAKQASFVLPNTRHELEVIRLWEQPLEMFLCTPGLLPFAVLSRVADRPEALRQAATQLEAIPDRRLQSNYGGTS